MYINLYINVSSLQLTTLNKGSKLWYFGISKLVNHLRLELHICCVIFPSVIMWIGDSLLTISCLMPLELATEASKALSHFPPSHARQPNLCCCSDSIRWELLGSSFCLETYDYNSRYWFPNYYRHFRNQNFLLHSALLLSWQPLARFPCFK